MVRIEYSVFFECRFRLSAETHEATADGFILRGARCHKTKFTNCVPRRRNKKQKIIQRINWWWCRCDDIDIIEHHSAVFPSVSPRSVPPEVVAINSSINCRLFRMAYMTPVEPPTQPHDHMEFFSILSRAESSCLLFFGTWWSPFFLPIGGFLSTRVAKWICVFCCARKMFIVSTLLSVVK